MIWLEGAGFSKNKHKIFIQVGGHADIKLIKNTPNKLIFEIPKAPFFN